MPAIGGQVRTGEVLDLADAVRKSVLFELAAKGFCPIVVTDEVLVVEGTHDCESVPDVVAQIARQGAERIVTTLPMSCSSRPADGW
jgi:hypothetical protein